MRDSLTRAGMFGVRHSPGPGLNPLTGGNIKKVVNPVLIAIIHRSGLDR